nr:hypothetical protein [uncultured Prevotella sp.]
MFIGFLRGEECLPLFTLSSPLFTFGWSRLSWVKGGEERVKSQNVSSSM